MLNMVKHPTKRFNAKCSRPLPSRLTLKKKTFKEKKFWIREELFVHSYVNSFFVLGKLNEEKKNYFLINFLLMFVLEQRTLILWNYNVWYNVQNYVEFHANQKIHKSISVVVSRRKNVLSTFCTINQ